MKTKKLKLSDLFEISRGVRIPSTKQVDGGIAYIGAGLDNNGIIKYLDYTGVIFNNGITVVAQGKNVGKTYYHNYPFIAYDKCLILTLKSGIITENLYLYLKAYLENITSKELTINILNDLIINIPMEINNKIDYNAINKFINSLKANIKFNKLNNTVNGEPLKLTIDSWEDFLLGDLFNVKGVKGTKLSEIKKREFGRYPYITSQSKNNGVYNTFDIYEETGNVIAIDSVCTGKAYYIEDNFSSIQGIVRLEAKFKMNKYIGIFICTLLNYTLEGQYNYNRKFTLDKIKQTKVKLPTKNGSLDIKWIENYIKSLKYSNLL